MRNGNKIITTWLGIVFCGALLAGCAGEQAFTTAARPGETIMLAAGYQQALGRDDLTVTITPETGAPVVYSPGDNRVRAVFNAYPDPVSKLIVSDRAAVTYPGAGVTWDWSSFGPLTPFTSGMVRNFSGGGNDWSNTLVFLDLPTAVPAGAATISLSAGGTPVAQPMRVEILSVPAGERNTFDYQNSGGVMALMRAIERAPHFVVSLNEPNGVVPYAVQVDFGRTLAAEGRPWVTHGRGDMVNVQWADTGSVLRVLLTPANGTSVSSLADFKFYITGAVTGLNVDNIRAYDVSGNPLPNVTAVSQYVEN